MTPGTYLVTAYFGVFYVIPMIGNILFRDDIYTIYHVAPLTPHVGVLLIGVFALFLLLSRGPTVRIAPAGLVEYLQRTAAAVGEAYQRRRLTFAMVFLGIAAAYAAAGAGNYRYLAEGLSETDSAAGIVVIMLNLVVTLDLFYCMFVRAVDRLEMFSRRHLANVLLSLGLILTANGTAAMLQALLSLAYSLHPVWFHRILFNPPHERTWTRVRRLVIVGACGAVVFGAAWVAGEVIKVSAGVNRDLASAWNAMWNILDESRFMEGYGYYLVGATSSYYYTLLFTAGASPDVLSGGAVSAIVHPLQSFWFRLDLLTGGFLDAVRPAIGSLSRLNYTLLSAVPVLSLREGSSPGIIGSFNYVVPFPLNVLFTALYLCWIARLTNSLLRKHAGERLSIIGAVLLLFYMLLLFQSPFDLLILFDNATAHVLLLVGIRLATEYGGTQPAAAGSARQGARVLPVTGLSESRLQT
jgi:hypothetical protein